MGRKTFRGGVHPDDKKALSSGREFRTYLAKGEMVFPLAQHIGRPAAACVKKGDQVLAGQVIGEASGFISANIISSCSGTVKAVEKRRTVMGTMVESVVIDNDGAFTEVPGIGEEVDFRTLTKDEIIKKVKDAGIVGLGGAGFPTHVKLAPKNADEINYVIANGAECEPYITCDDQLMRTNADEIVMGMEIILSLFPNAQGVILIEDNKPEAIASMQKACKGVKRLYVQAVPVKYPQGGERSIIHVVAGIDIKSTQLPADVGCIVDNVATIQAIYNAVCKSTPLMVKPVTITGEGVAEPANLLVRIGTNVQELLDAAGGVKEGVTVKKVIGGGPMMGIAIATLDVPIQKANNAFTFLTEDQVEAAEAIQTACIRCGRCNQSCPLGLNPQLMSVAAERKDYDRYENVLYGLECISCGSCTFICPAKRPLMQLFKEARTQILGAKAIARAEAAKAKMEAEKAAQEEKEAEIRKAVEAALRKEDEGKNLVKASEAEKKLAARAEAADNEDIPLEKAVKKDLGVKTPAGDAAEGKGDKA
ncbi:MAG: electron transport complex subunit RsxC [Lachnospiraceae bacterium]|nr:electron transport complex subunit RsxC [Lachnospiraceae bacterium]